MDIINDLKLDFTSEDSILELQGDIKAWFELFLNVYQAKDVTPYMHALHCHNTTIELPKIFSDLQITKELMPSSNCF